MGRKGKGVRQEKRNAGGIIGGDLLETDAHRRILYAHNSRKNNIVQKAIIRLPRPRPSWLWHLPTPPTAVGNFKVPHRGAYPCGVCDNWRHAIKKPTGGGGAIIYRSTINNNKNITTNSKAMRRSICSLHFYSRIMIAFQKTTLVLPGVCRLNAVITKLFKPFKAQLFVEQRKMIFYNKTLHSDNAVLRILCALHRNEAQKLSSVYHIFPGHSSSFDIKRAVWSSYVSSLTVWLTELLFYCFLFLCVYFCHVLLLSVLQFCVFVCFYCVLVVLLLCCMA